MFIQNCEWSIEIFLRAFVIIRRSIVFIHHFNFLSLLIIAVGWVKNSLCRVNKGLWSLKSCYIFIISQFHSKVQNRAIRLPSKVISMFKNMIKFCRVSSIVNINYCWCMDRLTALPSFHYSFILSIICSKIRMHWSFQFHTIDKSNICMKPSSFIFKTRVLEIGVNSNRCKFFLLIVLLFIILPFLDCMIEACVPFFNVFLKELRWILISRCWRLHKACARCTCLIKLNCIRDSQTTSENLIRKYWFCVWFIFPLYNRFLNINWLTLSLVSCFSDEEQVFGSCLSVVCSLASSWAIQVSLLSIYYLLVLASPSLWEAQKQEWSFLLMG